jgi:hypothetical protein
MRSTSPKQSLEENENTTQRDQPNYRLDWNQLRWNEERNRTIPFPTSASRNKYPNPKSILKSLIAG